MAAIGQVQDIVVEPVVGIPQVDAILADIVHGATDVDEMLEELAGDVLINGIFLRELERNLKHVQTIHAHPAGPVRLLDVAAHRKRGAAVKDPDIIQAQKAALKDVSPLGVFAVDPPREVQQQLVKDPFQKSPIAKAASLLIDLVDPPGSPGMHRRVDVVEVSLVRGQLPVRVHVPLPEQQQQLVFCELGIDEGQRYAVKGQIPCSIPRILPFVGHGDHVGVV